jgi:DNA repair protein RadC
MSKLTQVYGIGSSKYEQLQAIFEMGRSALDEQMQVEDILNSPKQVSDFICFK